MEGTAAESTALFAFFDRVRACVVHADTLLENAKAPVVADIIVATSFANDGWKKTHSYTKQKEKSSFFFKVSRLNHIPVPRGRPKQRKRQQSNH